MSATINKNTTLFLFESVFPLNLWEKLTLRSANVFFFGKFTRIYALRSRLFLPVFPSAIIFFFDICSPSKLVGKIDKCGAFFFRRICVVAWTDFRPVSLLFFSFLKFLKVTVVAVIVIEVAGLSFTLTFTFLSSCVVRRGTDVFFLSLSLSPLLSRTIYIC